MATVLMSQVTTTKLPELRIGRVRLNRFFQDRLVGYHYATCISQLSW